MVRYSEKGVSYTVAFFMLIAFGIGATLLSGLIALPVLAGMSGKSISFIADHLQDMIGDPAYLREMQVLQTLSAIIGFFVPTLFVAARLTRGPLQLTGFKGTISPRSLLFTIFIMACGLALSSALGYFTYKLPFPVNWRIMFDRLEDNYAENAAGLINLSSVPELLLSIIVLALVPAICEETFFRGGLQNYLYRSNGKMWLSILIVSIIFSAVHASVYGFLARFALGIILGLLYQYSGRIWLNILAHFINNAAAVIAMYSQKASGKSMQQILNDKDGSYIGFIAVPFIILLFMQYKKETAQNRNIINGV
ncbi:MAG: type II CAAX endopeptidase family protein [Niabella sp.]